MSISSLIAAHAVDAALSFFFLRLLLAVAMHPRMLTPRYGRYHRILGMVLFVYLMLGMVDARVGFFNRDALVLYDAVLSCLGLAVSYSAASEFGVAHSKVKNEASGVLDEHATVTRAEMVEHCFCAAAWHQPAPVVLQRGLAQPGA